MASVTTPRLESEDIQGILLSGYGHLRCSSYFFLHFEDGPRARAWLAQIVPQVTTAQWDTGTDGTPEKPQWALNVAFTCSGLDRLSLSPEALKSFPQELLQGMTQTARSRRLGDTQESDPKNWEIGRPLADGEAANEIHAVLIVQEKDEAKLDERCRPLQDLAQAHGVRTVGDVQQGYLPMDGREHFGFADAISEPNLEGSPKPPADGQSCVQPGEFILGYLNEYDKLPPTPTVSPESDVHNNLKEMEHAPSEQTVPREKDLGRNGSYMVFRKLQQDVAGFRRYFEVNFADKAERERMQAKFVGRWPSGAPLVLAPDRDNPTFARFNAFCYMETDPHGLRCPIAAHTRRVNPRDSLGDNAEESIRSVNRHRILRRGALYGKKLAEGVLADDGTPRGVLFFGINTDIRRQFEFIQQTWINNPKFNGLHNDRDPILGNNQTQQSKPEDGPWNMTIPAEPVRRRLIGLPRFVSVTGGCYFFLPSISALSFLAGIRKPATPQSPTAQTTV